MSKLPPQAARAAGALCLGEHTPDLLLYSITALPGQLQCLRSMTSSTEKNPELQAVLAHMCTLRSKEETSLLLPGQVTGCILAALLDSP